MQSTYGATDSALIADEPIATVTARPSTKWLWILPAQATINGRGSMRLTQALAGVDPALQNYCRFASRANHSYILSVLADIYIQIKVSMCQKRDLQNSDRLMYLTESGGVVCRERVDSFLNNNIYA